VKENINKIIFVVVIILILLIISFFWYKNYQEAKEAQIQGPSLLQMLDTSSNDSPQPASSKVRNQNKKSIDLEDASVQFFSSLQSILESNIGDFIKSPVLPAQIKEEESQVRMLKQIPAPSFIATPSEPPAVQENKAPTEPMPSAPLPVQLAPKDLSKPNLSTPDVGVQTPDPKKDISKKELDDTNILSKPRVTEEEPIEDLNQNIQPYEDDYDDSYEDAPENLDNNSQQ
jgi:hypothetical protein